MPPDLKASPSIGPIPWSMSREELQNGPLNGPMLVEDGPGRMATSATPSQDPLATCALEALISDPVCQRLFRLFLLFAGDNFVRHPMEGRLLRCVTRAQAKFLLGQIGLLRDQMQICPDRPLPSVHSEEDAQLPSGLSASQIGMALEFAGEQVTFRELLGQALALCPRRLQFVPLVDRLFARYVLQIVRKGFLLCRPVRLLPRALRAFSCCLLPSGSSPAERMASIQRGGFCRPSAGRWRPFWCVLMPGQLHMWPLAAGRSGREDRKAHLDRTILEMDPLEQDWMEGVEGRRSLKLTKDSLLELSDLEKGGQLFGWLLATRSCLLEFAHFDQLQRQLWLADLEMVVRKRRPSLLLHFDRVNSARTCRPFDQRAMRRSPSVGKQLLQRENRELLEQLESERRALRDEETVREMATRMLDEELQRGDSLRKTVQFLSGQLEAEKQQRMELENRLYQESQASPSEGQALENGWTREEAEEMSLFPLSPEELALFPASPHNLAPPERLVTPMARPKKGKRLRDSVRRKRQREELAMGKEAEELKVVNVIGPRQREEEKHLAGYELCGTLRANDDIWEAQKCGTQEMALQKGGGGMMDGEGPIGMDAKLLMIMSTRSV